VASNTFLLSRIYGQGWNAARKLQAAGEPGPDKAGEAALNPYRAVEEREHWSKGFRDALESPARQFNGRRDTPWR
jgi:hypothetical protein